MHCKIDALLCILNCALCISEKIFSYTLENRNDLSWDSWPNLQFFNGDLQTNLQNSPENFACQIRSWTIETKTEHVQVRGKSDTDHKISKSHLNWDYRDFSFLSSFWSRTLVSSWVISIRNCRQAEESPGSFDGRNAPWSTVETEWRPWLWPKTCKYQVSLERKYLPFGFPGRCKHVQDVYHIWGFWYLVKSPSYLEGLQSLQNTLLPFPKFTATPLKTS